MIRLLLILFLFITATANAQNYIINKDFEDSNIKSGINTVATCCEDGDSQEIVSSPVRAGTKAVRVTADSTVKKDDPRVRADVSHWVWTGEQLVRAELVKYDVSQVTGGNERWYGFSIYVPSTWDDPSNDPNGSIISQWHGVAGSDCNLSPPLAIGIMRNDYGVAGENIWRVTAIPDPCTPGSGTHGSHTRINIDLTPVQKDTWTDWVIYAKWSHLNDGVTKIWQNGNLVVDRVNTPNGRNTEFTIGHRLSIYKNWWTWLPEVPPTLTAYFDEWRVTDQTGSYEAVAPRNGQTQKLATPSNLAVSQ